MALPHRYMYHSHTTYVNNHLQKTTPKQPTFIQFLHTQHPNDTLASSVYSVPASQAIDSGGMTEFPSMVSGHEQRSAHHYIPQRVSSKRSIAITGNVLRSTEAPRSTEAHTTGIVRHAEVDHGSSRPGTAPSSTRAGEWRKEVLESLERRSTDQSSKHTFRQPLQRRRQLSRHPPVSLSNKVCVTDEQNTAHSWPRRSSLVRRLSDRAKKALCSPPKPDEPVISEPFNFHDFDPKAAHPGILHPDIKAVPLAEAQKRPEPPRRRDGLTRLPGSQKQQAETPLVQQKIKKYFIPVENGVSRRPSQSGKASAKVKIVRDSDEGTQFGDFIEAANALSSEGQFQDGVSTEGEIEIALDQNIQIQRLLPEHLSRPAAVPEPLNVSKVRHTPARPRRPDEVPRRKPVRKHVDTSRYSWVPRNHKKCMAEAATQILATHVEENAAEYEHTDDENPILENLLDSINGILAHYNDTSALQRKPLREDHCLDSTLACISPEPSVVNGGEGDDIYWDHDPSENKGCDAAARLKEWLKMMSDRCEACWF